MKCESKNCNDTAKHFHSGLQIKLCTNCALKLGKIKGIPLKNFRNIYK